MSNSSDANAVNNNYHINLCFNGQMKLERPYYEQEQLNNELKYSKPKTSKLKN